MRNPADRTTLRSVTSPQDAVVDGKMITAAHLLEKNDRVGYACAVGWSTGA